MSRSLVKAFLSVAAALFGIFGISAACTISPDAGWQYTFADKSCNVPPAILSVKRVVDSGDFYKDFLNEWDKDIRYMAVPTNAQKMEYNTSFTGLVHTIRFEQGKQSSSKLASYLQGLLQDMWAKYKDESLTFEDRTKFAYLYFLNFRVIEELRNTSDIAVIEDNNTPSYVPTYAGLTFIEKYTTINGVQYSLWQGNIYYVFSKGDSMEINTVRRSRSLDTLINFLEYQNRMVVRAPNGKKYAIWKYDNAYKINRENGTILSNNFASYAAAKQFLDTCAVNGYVDPKYHNMCGFNTYGKR